MYKYIYIYINSVYICIDIYIYLFLLIYSKMILHQKYTCDLFWHATGEDLCFLHTGGACGGGALTFSVQG